MKAAVIVFPGSNCDRDAAVALEAATGKPPAMVWHGDAELPKDICNVNSGRRGFDIRHEDCVRRQQGLAQISGIPGYRRNCM